MAAMVVTSYRFSRWPGEVSGFDNDQNESFSSRQITQRQQHITALQWPLYTNHRSHMRSNRPATRHRWTCLTLTPARQAGTRFTYPWRMKGWVGLGVGYIPRWLICPQKVLGTNDHTTLTLEQMWDGELT